MTTDASTGAGTRATKNLPHMLKASSTIMAARPANLLRAPADSAAEDAENPAPTGIPCNNPAATFAKPNATNSRSAITLSLWSNARPRIEPQDSANNIKNNGTDSSMTRDQSSNERPGQDGLGIEIAMAPTKATWCAGRSTTAENSTLTASTSVEAGKPRNRRKIARPISATP